MPTSVPTRRAILVLLEAIAQISAGEDLDVALPARLRMLHRRRCPRQWYSAQMDISRPRADIEKMDDVQRLRVEDESSQVFRGQHTQLVRACNHEWCERR